MLDGADNNSMSTNLQERSPQVVAPPVDALQEFKVQTRTYSAEFGKAAGAVINASVKQGGNQFRGTFFEFFRDEALNANTWTTTAPVCARDHSPSTSRAPSSAARSCAARRSSSATIRHRGPNGRSRRWRQCQRRGCGQGI